jgi:clan AA aspartic protease (TIGR02281 family)
MRNLVILVSIGVFAVAFAWPELSSLLGRSDIRAASSDDIAAEDRGPAQVSSAGTEQHRRNAVQAAERSRPSNPRVANVGWNEIAIERDSRGHFIADFWVNGTPVTFLVDSGATDVVLSPDDARKVGLGYLEYDRVYNTANGKVRAASVTFREVRIGQMSVRSVPGAVNEAEMGISLLGMSFLSKLRGFESTGERLILRY